MIPGGLCVANFGRKGLRWIETGPQASVRSSGEAADAGGYQHCQSAVHCLRLTCVKTVKQLLDTSLVFRNPDDQPRDGFNIDRWYNIGLGGQFRRNRWRDEYLPI